MKFINKLLILLVILISGCSIFSSKNLNDVSSIDNKSGLLDVQCVNPDQTNQTDYKILSINEVKNQVLLFLKKSGYTSWKGPILKFPKYSYITNASFGPVVFVENIGTNYWHKYYYVFYGIMPDGALCASVALDASTGEVFKAGMIEYSDSNKTYLFGKHDVINYVTNNYSESTNISIRAIFYYDSDSFQIDPKFCWKYELYRHDKKHFRLKKGKDSERIYIDPFVVGHKKIAKENNGFNRFFHKRVCTLEDDVIPINGKWNQIHKRAHYKD
jgi:hypothetical protein